MEDAPEDVGESLRIHVLQMRQGQNVNSLSGLEHNEGGGQNREKIGNIILAWFSNWPHATQEPRINRAWWGGSSELS